MIVIGPIGLIVALVVIGWLFRDSDFLSCLGCYGLVLLFAAALTFGEYLGWWEMGFWPL